MTAYGILDVAYKNYTLKNAQGDVVIKSNGVSDGTNAGPRLGFKGTEDLGGGLKATFNLESDVNIDTGRLSAASATGR